MNTQDYPARPAHVPANLVVDFDVYNPPGVEQDLQLPWKRLQESGVPDMVWSSCYGGHWLPTRGKLAAAMYADHENFSNRLSILPREVGEHHFGIPQSLDPPQHGPFRMLLNSLLGPKQVMTMETEIRTLAISMIEGLRTKGHCDFANDYANMLPVSIFLRMVDLPLADREMLLELNNSIIRPNSATMNGEEAIRRLQEYLSGPVQQRLGHDGQDMFSKMINGTVFGRKLTSDEALNMAYLVMQGGIDTVSNLMSLAMRFLAEHPEKRRELQLNPASIPAAIEEMVRRFPVTVQVRTVRHDIHYGGVDMKQGDIVVLGTPVAGLDERDNPDSAQCDFHRAAREHTTFGNGPHRCPGAHLARLEMRITLEEWLARIPEFELASSDIRCRGGVVGGLVALPLRWDVSSTH